MATENNLEKLQRLLRQMFQFDCADPDFGIYRIMNHTRDAVERFIRTDLPEAISKELSSGMLATQSQPVAELQDVAGQIRESLGDAALNSDGTWSKQKFADCHILFLERSSDYDYARMLLASAV